MPGLATAPGALIRRHGRVLATVLHQIMAFSLPGAVDAYTDVAEALGEPIAGLCRVAAVEHGIEAARRSIRDCPGAPQLSEFGVREEHIEALTEDGDARGHRATNPRIATRADVAAIYRAAM